jgi:hypothetical protein
LRLNDGEMKPSKTVNGAPFAVSPDGNSVAFLSGHQLFLTWPADGRKELLADLPEMQLQTGYKGMGFRAPVWSPGGDLIVVFGTDRLVLARVE